MVDDDIEQERTTNQARAGSTPHIVRYILIISLILALIAMATVYFVHFQPGEQPTATDQVEESKSGSTV
ncbi:MAG: hypothetical protein ACRCY3_12930 [Sphingorhabdus sp.]